LDNSSAEIDLIKNLIRTIGTPFNKPQMGLLEDLDVIHIYHLAKTNKIGLLFLEALQNKFVVDELLNELHIQRKCHADLRGTSIRVACLLDEINCKYAIIKSNFPFAAVPNDVDVLVLGNKSEYYNATRKLSKSSFVRLGEAPLESCFHDQTRGVHKDPKIKDSLDVDVYREVGAGRIIYMDKKRMLNLINQISVDGHTISTLSPSGEMALSMFHSIFPERIFTLLLYYQILHTIANMPKAHFEEFIRLCNDHHLRFAALTTLSLSETIHETCFEQAPLKLTELRQAFGKKVIFTIDKLPYHYPTKIILSSFWNKKTDRIFAFSFFTQLIHMLNPKYAKYVATVNRERKSRNTY
jgi:hypothetical protein